MATKNSSAKPRLFAIGRTQCSKSLGFCQVSKRKAQLFLEAIVACNNYCFHRTRKNRSKCGTRQPAQKGEQGKGRGITETPRTVRLKKKTPILAYSRIPLQSPLLRTTTRGVCIPEDSDDHEGDKEERRRDRRREGAGLRSKGGLARCLNDGNERERRRERERLRSLSRRFRPARVPRWNLPCRPQNPLFPPSRPFPFPPFPGFPPPTGFPFFPPPLAPRCVFRYVSHPPAARYTALSTSRRKAGPREPISWLPLPGPTGALSNNWSRIILKQSFSFSFMPPRRRLFQHLSRITKSNK